MSLTDKAETANDVQPQPDPAPPSFSWEDPLLMMKKRCLQSITISPIESNGVSPTVPQGCPPTADHESPVIGIGERLAAPLLPHHRAYGSVPRRFGGLAVTLDTVSEDRAQ